MRNNHLLKKNRPRPTQNSTCCITIPTRPTSIQITSAVATFTTEHSLRQREKKSTSSDLRPKHRD